MHADELDTVPSPPQLASGGKVDRDLLNDRPASHRSSRRDRSRSKERVREREGGERRRHSHRDREKDRGDKDSLKDKDADEKRRSSRRDDPDDDRKSHRSSRRDRSRSRDRESGRRSRSHRHRSSSRDRASRSARPHEANEDLPDDARAVPSLSVKGAAASPPLSSSRAGPPRRERSISPAASADRDRKRSRRGPTRSRSRSASPPPPPPVADRSPARSAGGGRGGPGRALPRPLSPGAHDLPQRPPSPGPYSPPRRSSRPYSPPRRGPSPGYGRRSPPPYGYRRGPSPGPGPYRRGPPPGRGYSPPMRDDYRGPDRDYRARNRRSPSYDEYARQGGGPGPRRSPSPQLSEEQREMRSVFVSQLSARVLDRELTIFFDTQAGKVREARVIVDRISRRSKGVGYVEFVELETVQKALALSGSKLMGIPINVQYTEAEKNRQAMSGGPAAPQTGLFVGSLNFALTDADLRQVFQPFGQIEHVDLHKDPVTGKSKGYAFVQFKEHKDALTAMEKMNNFPLAGREIKVSLAGERQPSFNRAAAENTLDEGMERGLNAISRVELMQKLARTDTASLDLPPVNMYRPNIPQAVTRNVMMKDAFDPAEETERDWDIELRDDVKSEVEQKYGKVLDIFVVKESQGEIYIRFDAVESATKAVAGLNGRWFGGRQISASHCGDGFFDAKK